MSGSSLPFGFIDLFSGAGGFSLGFHLSGFTDLLAVERDFSAISTYHLNFPSALFLNRDIREVHSLEIERLCPVNPTVILASPPCEPFTAANINRKKTAWERFFEDPQGDLIFHALRIIKDLEPSFFVIENVAPLIEGNSRDIILEFMDRSPYSDIYFNIIRAEEHGLPSFRKRLFISNLPLNLDSRVSPTVEQALAGLPDPSFPNDFSNHFLTPLPEKIQKRVYQLNPGQAAVYYEGASEEKMNWIRLVPDSLSPTVMGKSRFLHFSHHRALTIREHARLMSFPDWFTFTGTIDEMYNQVGEAVPPLISYLIAEEIKKRLVDS